MPNVSGLTPFAQRAVPLAQRSLAAASVVAGYTVVGSIFSDAVIQLLIVSTLDQTVQASFDGVTDHFPIVAGSTIVLDFRSNEIAIPGNLGIYVKEIGNPTTGNLYVSAFSL
jgi:hypothetical protein